MINSRFEAWFKLHYPLVTSGRDTGMMQALFRCWIAAQSSPIDMLLWCPRCNQKHVDQPKGEWTNPPHATHTCQGCGLLWRPSNVDTNGVSALPASEVKHLDRFHNADPNTHRSLWEVVTHNESLPMIQSPSGRIFRIQELGAEGKQWGNPLDDATLTEMFVVRLNGVV